MARPVIAGLVVLLLALAWRGVDWATEKRDAVAATPVPEAGAPAPVELGPGIEACVNAVPFDEHAEAVRFRVLAGDPGALAVRAYGEGYAARGGAARATGGGLVTVPLEPAARPVIGELCIRNDGERAVALAGSTAGTARSDTRVVGTLDAPDIALTLLEREPRSLAARVPDLLERAAAFNPLATWTLWVVLALAVLGAPAAVLAALSVSLRERDPERRSP